MEIVNNFIVEEVKKVLQCDLCYQLLVEPVTIVCGSNLCKKHLDKQLETRTDEKGSFYCELCLKNHLIPNEGFTINKRLQYALHIPLFAAKQKYDECQEKMENIAKENLVKTELQENYEHYINQYFEDLIKLINKRRTEFKGKIDQSADDLILTLKNNKKDCLEVTNECKNISLDIVKSKYEFINKIKKFNESESSEKKWEDFTKSLFAVNERLINIVKDFNKTFLGNIGDSFQYKFTDTSSVFDVAVQVKIGFSFNL